MNKKGFTLIELLGVIILIAIISLLAFPSILNHIKKAQDTIDKTTKNLVITAAKNYVSDNLNYFPKVEGNVFCLTTSELLSKKYLDKTIIEENETLEDKTVQIKYLSEYNYSIVDSCSGTLIEIPDEEIIGPEYESIFDFDESTNTINGFKEGIDTSLYTNLIIPSEINGVTVTKIAASAFTGQGLTNLTLDSTVTTIGESAFSNNSIAGELDLSNVTSIGKSAFYNNKITGVSLSNKITNISSYAFSKNALISINVPGNVTEIGGNAFSYNITLTTINLEEGIQKIGDYAFRNHSASELTIPGSVKIISGGAFDATVTPPGGNLKKVIVEEGDNKGWFNYHIFNRHWPSITVYVDLNKDGNKKINWNCVINNNSSTDAAQYCNDESVTSLLDGMITCKYE